MSKTGNCIKNISLEKVLVRKKEKKERRLLLIRCLSSAFQAAQRRVATGKPGAQAG